MGDYVLAGGESAALAVIEAVTRLVPGVMGNQSSATDESFTEGRLEYPAVHPARRVPRVVGTRGAAVGRARAHRAVATSGGAAPDDGAAPRPDRRAIR